MDFKSIVIGYIFIAGFIGMANNTYFVWFHKMSDGTIRSPNRLWRYWWKYSTFSFGYFLSFILSPALLHPFLGYVNVKTIGPTAAALLFPLELLPLAFLLYWLMCKQLISAEERWRRAQQPWWARPKR